MQLCREVFYQTLFMKQIMLCWRDHPLISHGGCLPPARPPPGVFLGFIVGASAMWIAVSSVRYRTVLPLRYARCRILTKRDKKSCGIMGTLRKIAQRETAVLWERYERYSGSATIMKGNYLSQQDKSASIKLKFQENMTFENTGLHVPSMLQTK